MDKTDAQIKKEYSTTMETFVPEFGNEKHIQAVKIIKQIKDADPIKVDLIGLKKQVLFLLKGK